MAEPASISLSCPYPFTSMFDQASFVKYKGTHSFHFFLARSKIAPNLDLFKEMLIEQLNIPDPFFGLTPLHIAAMKGYEQIVKFLIDNGANLKACDNRGYNVLHHLQICQNNSIIKLIKETDQEHALDAMKTLDDKTPDDLANILSRKPAAPDEQVFHYLDPRTQTVVRNATAKKFKEMTGAQFTNYLVTSPEVMANNWLHDRTIDSFLDSLQHVEQRNYFQKAYDTYKTNPPFIYIRANLLFGGFELVAGEEILPHRVICLYLGQETVEEGNGNYCLAKVDASRIRGLGSFANDGCPNAVTVKSSLDISNGSSSLLMSRVKIAAGEAIKWSYGYGHTVKWDKRYEDLEELEKRYSDASFDAATLKLLECLKNPSASELSYEDKFNIITEYTTHVKYLFETPNALIHLIIKKIVSIQIVLLILNAPPVYNYLELPDTSLSYFIELIPLLRTTISLMEELGLTLEFNQFVFSYFKKNKVRSFVSILNDIVNYSHFPKNRRKAKSAFNELQQDLFAFANVLDAVAELIFKFTDGCDPEAISEAIANEVKKTPSLRNITTSNRQQDYVSNIISAFESSHPQYIITLKKVFVRHRLIPNVTHK